MSEIFPPIYTPKPGIMETTKSMGELIKMPRSRMSNKALQTNMNNVKLPAPKIGNTIGHSILEGINPVNPETFE